MYVVLKCSIFTCMYTCMFNADDSDSLAEDETEFETSNTSTSGNQISRGSPCSCKPDGSQSLSQVDDLSNLSSDDINSVDDITPGLLPTNTDHCNQQQPQQANMLCDTNSPETSNSSSDSEHGNSLSHTCDLIVAHSVSNGNGNGQSPSCIKVSKMTQSHSPSHMTAHAHNSKRILSSSQSLDQTCGDRSASSKSHSVAAKITRSPSRSSARTSNQVSTPSQSENTSHKVQFSLQAKAFKKTHPPSHRITHIGKQVSSHSHSHLHDGGHTLSQGGVSALSKSRWLSLMQEYSC